MENAQLQDFDLVVNQPFGSWQKGDIITDAAQCAEILASDNASHVTKRGKTPTDDGGNAGGQEA